MHIEFADRLSVSFIAEKTTDEEDTEDLDVTEDREYQEGGNAFKAGENLVLSVVGL